MTNWLPGIVALGAGCAGGIAALALSKRARPKAAGAAEADGAAVAASAAESAMEALRELDADKHHYDPVDFAAERARLERVAAEALRARDGGGKAGGGTTGAKPGAKTAGAIGAGATSDARDDGGLARRHPQLVGAAWGGGVVGFCWLAFALLSGAEPSTAGAMRAGGMGSASQEPARPAASGTADPRYESLLVLSAIAISIGDHEKILQGWELYMNQPPPRRRPPMLQKAYDWLEKIVQEEE